MNKCAFIGLLLNLGLFTGLAKAQEFGGNPPSLKWQQITTPAARVIFPSGLDSVGERVANIVTQMNKAIQPTIGNKQKQISILLQNQTTVSNAYVGLAPFRSEFYLTPEQNSFDIGSLPWDEQLAIHEFRHVQQYNNFNVGLSKVLHILFGEGGQALGNDLAIPNWFFEGDAVFNETHVSQQGRGRLPFFFNGFRVLWADGKDYSYMKIRNGSLVDYTPDWYPLGYMLVSYGREKYGDDFWKTVTHDAAAYKGGFYPFQKAIKRYSGLSFKQFRQNGLNYFKSQFANSDKSLSNKKTKHFDADREYPAYINDSTLIYMKTAYNHIPVFVVKNGNKERKISTRSVSLDNYFAYHNGKVIYPAYRSDLRWGYRDFSELMLLDIASGKEHRITKGTKYFSPSFSPDGENIVAVNQATSGKNELHILNLNGDVVELVPNKHKLFFTYPKYLNNSSFISPVRDSKGKMSLAQVDIKSGDIKYLTPFSYQPIVFPVINGDTVYFSATAGIDDKLFALTLGNGRLYVLNNDTLKGSVGNYEPAVSSNHLAYTSLTSTGYQVTQLSRKSVSWIPLPSAEIPGGLPDFNISALTRDTATDILAKVENKELPITKYSKSYHLFNFHSLIPNFSDPNYTISLTGENVLNTFQSEVLFNYNRDEGYKEFGFDAVYGALFPYIYGGADYTIDRRAFTGTGDIYWNETNLHAGLEVPLNFSRGKDFTGLTFGSDVNYSRDSFRDTALSVGYTYLNNYVYFSHHTQQARQNIYPRLGQNISVNYKSAISGETATQFLASGTFYFPGFMANDNLIIGGAHQQRTGDNIYSNDFPFSRGYTAENFQNMNKLGASYAFPIAYPDAGFANLIYFLRLRGNAFFDYTHVSNPTITGGTFKADFKSAGFELFFDTQWFNQESISFGVRYSHLLNDDLFGGTGRNRIELIVPVTFF